MEKAVMIIFYVVIVLAFLYLAKKIADGLTKFDDDEAIEKDGNVAVALRRFGLYVGMCISLAGVMTGGVYKTDVLYFVSHGFIATIIFFLAHYINDFLIVPGVRNNDLVKEGNAPTGFAEAGSFIATGVILNGAFTGEVGGLLSCAVFFFLGQAMLIIVLFIHRKVFRLNIVALIKEGNLSAGIAIAGLLISYSLILRVSIAGDFLGWLVSLETFAVTAVTGMVGLICFQKLADILFLPKSHFSENLERNNIAGVIVVQAITIALSLVISRLL